jgi:hypothetical protein
LTCEAFDETWHSAVRQQANLQKSSRRMTSGLRTRKPFIAVESAGSQFTSRSNHVLRGRDRFCASEGGGLGHTWLDPRCRPPSRKTYGGTRRGSRYWLLEAPCHSSAVLQVGNFFDGTKSDNDAGVSKVNWQLKSSKYDVSNIKRSK